MKLLAASRRRVDVTRTGSPPDIEGCCSGAEIFLYVRSVYVCTYIYNFSCNVEVIDQGYCMVVVGNSFIKMENRKNGTIILHAEDKTQHVLHRGVGSNKYLPFYILCVELQ
jgi:hypothetical protein